MSQSDVLRIKLRNWVLDKNPNCDATAFTDDTNIIESRLVNSLQIMDMLLFIEHVTGNPIDVTRIQPGTFKSISTIVNSFFNGA